MMCVPSTYWQSENDPQSQRYVDNLLGMDKWLSVKTNLLLFHIFIKHA